MAHGRVVTTEAEMDAALERAKEFDLEPRVTAAEYNHEVDVVVLHLTTGRRLVIPREELQGLEEAAATQLVEMEVFAGLSVAWPQLDVDHYLPHLLAGRYGNDRWMEGLGRRGVAA
jgi:hypothetical protein